MDGEGLRRRAGGTEPADSTGSTSHEEIIAKEGATLEEKAKTAPAQGEYQPPRRAGGAPRDEDAKDFTKTCTYEILRYILIFVIYVILQKIVQDFVLDPIFKPAPTNVRDKVVQQLCPSGEAGCAYQIPKDWKP